MKIARVILAAALAVGIATQASAPASALQVKPMSGPCNFWFICC